MVKFCNLLIIEGRTRVEDSALIVIYVISKTEVETEVKCDILPCQRSEYITVYIRIRISYYRLVRFIYHAVAVEVNETHISGTKLNILSSCVLHHKIPLRTCCTCLCIRSKDAVCLVTIEKGYWISDGNKNVILSIDRVSIVAIRKRSHLIHITTYCRTKLQSPITQCHRLTRQC